MSLVTQRYLPIRRTLSFDHIDGANKQLTPLRKNAAPYK